MLLIDVKKFKESMMIDVDEEIKSFIIAKIKELEETQEKCRIMIADYRLALKKLTAKASIEGKVDQIIPNAPQDSHLKFKVNPVINKRPVTMQEKIKAVLREANKPLTSREIMNLMNKMFTDKQYDFEKNFSGNFSQYYRKAGVKRHEEPTNPIESRVFYCLEEWFGDDGLKQEFREMLKSNSLEIF